MANGHYSNFFPLWSAITLENSESHDSPDNLCHLSFWNKGFHHGLKSTLPDQPRNQEMASGRWEGGLGWGIHVKPWLILVNVWQKPLQYCKVISLQLIKKKKKEMASTPMKDILIMYLLLTGNQSQNSRRESILKI